MLLDKGLSGVETKGTGSGHCLTTTGWEASGEELASLRESGGSGRGRNTKPPCPEEKNKGHLWGLTEEENRVLTEVNPQEALRVSLGGSVPVPKKHNP